jgi:hypothetical protein
MKEFWIAMTRDDPEEMFIDCNGHSHVCRAIFQEDKPKDDEEIIWIKVREVKQEGNDEQV